MRRKLLEGGGYKSLHLSDFSPKIQNHIILEHPADVLLKTQGIQRTWTRLLAGESGIVSTRHLGEEFTRLPSQVAGLVPLGKLVDGGWDASEHVSKDVSSLNSLTAVTFQVSPHR
jgi:hypothetical protein